MSTDVDLNLQGKTAVVTGATAGIGRGIATALSSEGVRVALVARRSTLLDGFASELRDRFGTDPVIVQQDLADPEAPARIATRALQALGQIDILVNGAGGHPKDDHSEEVWESVMLLNFTQQRRLADLVVPSMVAHGWGRVINITGKSEPPRVSPAFAAKAATHAWAKGLSRDLGSHGVTVNSIAPGRILTEQMSTNYNEAERAEHAKDIPVGRYGRPEEFGDLVAFLCSPRADYITGTVIPFDGGLRRYQF